MIKEYIKALFLILMAEMGDKTQILALAFATRYGVAQVLTGVFIGALLNHGLAVILGAYLSVLFPLEIIQIVAGFIFIAFALWTLKIEDNEEENVTTNKSPIFTVALAFFIGELGDKTQLTAITLSADAKFPLAILFGTVSGMVIVSAMGIYVGCKICKKIPEVTIKMISAVIFLYFGVCKLYQSLPEKYLLSKNILLFAVVLTILFSIRLIPFIKNMEKNKRVR